MAYYLHLVQVMIITMIPVPLFATMSVEQLVALLAASRNA
jgi:hypothetical protein